MRQEDLWAPYTWEEWDREILPELRRPLSLAMARRDLAMLARVAKLARPTKEPGVWLGMGPVELADRWGWGADKAGIQRARRTVCGWQEWADPYLRRMGVFRDWLEARKAEERRRAPKITRWVQAQLDDLAANG